MLCEIPVLERERTRLVVATPGDDRSVVLLDLDMPNMDGFNVLGHLEREGIRPKGIAVTGSRAGHRLSGDAVMRRVRSIYTGEVDFLPKPDPFTHENVEQWIEDIRLWASCKVYGC